MRNRRRRGYKFTEKKHSRQGILATVLALALLIWYLVFLKFAFQGGGSLSVYYGSAGVIAMIATFVVRSQKSAGRKFLPVVSEAGTGADPFGYGLLDRNLYLGIFGIKNGKKETNYEL